MTDSDLGIRNLSREFLESGVVTPDEHEKDAARVERITREAEFAFDRLRDIYRGVTIFGSARTQAATEWGILASDIGRALAAAGFTVVTGGGPGLMEAANAGALRGGGESVGLTIELPHHEPPNEFLTLEVPFHYFFLRKLALVKYSCAFVLLPGGFGTLDELFEALNLRRTNKLEEFPIILVGSSYWSGLVNWLQSAAVNAGTLTQADVDELIVADDAETVLSIVTACHATLCRRFGIAP